MTTTKQTLPSSKSDIVNNINKLGSVAKEFLARNDNESDWWEGVTIDNIHYDINVYDWEDDNQRPIRIVNAHPVSLGSDGYFETDMDTWVRLAVEMLPQDLDIN